MVDAFLSPDCLPLYHLEVDATVVGLTDPAGDQRTAYLPGQVEVGGTVRAIGRLSVVDHPGRKIGAAVVPAWVDVRVDGLRR